MAGRRQSRRRASTVSVAYALAPRWVSKAALIAAAALSSAACDSDADVSDADLDDLRDEFDCENVRVVAPTARRDGNLTTSDCEDGDSYFDLYASRIKDDGETVNCDAASVEEKESAVVSVVGAQNQTGPCRGSVRTSAAPRD